MALNMRTCASAWLSLDFFGALVTFEVFSFEEDFFEVFFSEGGITEG